MAGPGGREAGRVTVKVVPDTSEFAAKVRAALEKVDDLEVSVSADTTKAAAEIAAFRKRMEANDINLDVDVDRKAFAGMASSLGSVAQSATKAASGMADMGGALTGAASGATQLGGSFASAAGGASNIGSSIASAAASIAMMVLQAAALSAAIVAIGAAAMFVVGAVTAAVGALPAALALVAAPIGAIVLGFEGIKNAAKVVQPQFDAMQKSVQATFERGMIPAFEALKGVFPVLTDGLNSMAISLSGMATQLAKTVSSAAGVQNLRLAFEGIKTALDIATPGVVALVDSLLRVAGTTGVYQALGGIINDMTTGFAGFLDKIRESGALVEGLNTLRTVFGGIGTALGAISTAALDFFNGAGPGVAQVFTSIGEAIGRIDWAKLGEDLGRVMGAISSAIDSIPPGVFDALAFSFQLLGDAISGLVASGGLDLLLLGFAGLVSIAALVIAFFAGLANHVTQLIGFISTLASLWAQGWSIMMSALGSFIGWVGGALASLGSTILSWITSAMASVVSFFQNGWNRATQVTAQAFNSLRTAVSNGVNSAVQFVSSLPGRIVGALGNLGSLLINAGRSLIQGFVNGIKSMIGAAVSAAKSAVQAVRNFFPFSPAKEGPFSGRGYTIYSGQALVEDWASGIKSGTGTAVAAVNSMMSAANDAATAEWRGQIASDGYGGLAAAVQEGVIGGFNGSKLTVDGSGLARIVNTTNSRNARR